MKINYNNFQIENLIRKHYPDAYDIQVIHGGLVSQTFLFWSGNNKYVFQIGGERRDYEKELYIANQYKDLLPVKIVDGVYEDLDGQSYIFSDYIEKCRVADLDFQEFINIIPSILETIDKLSKIEVPANSGFGKFDANGIARFNNWREYIEAVYDDKIYNWQKFNFEQSDFSVIDKAFTALQTNIDCIAVNQLSCLIHGDLGGSNLLTDGKQISGIIDWNYSMYGDPLYEIAQMLFWTDNEDSKRYKPLVSALKDKYLTDDINKKKIYCYIVRMGLEEIYNTAVLDIIGYDIDWVINRLNEVVKNK